VPNAKKLSRRPFNGQFHGGIGQTFAHFPRSSCARVFSVVFEHNDGNKFKLESHTSQTPLNAKCGFFDDQSESSAAES